MLEKRRGILVHYNLATHKTLLSRALAIGQRGRWMHGVGTHGKLGVGNESTVCIRNTLV